MFSTGIHFNCKIFNHDNCTESQKTSNISLTIFMIVHNKLEVFISLKIMSQWIEKT